MYEQLQLKLQAVYAVIIVDFPFIFRKVAGFDYLCKQCLSSFLSLSGVIARAK